MGKNMHKPAIRFAGFTDAWEQRMPLIHVELKKSGVPLSQAYNQIEKYAAEGVFTGLFALVQVFVAMNPEEAVYFANPGPEGRFNPNYYFHWADFNNEPINEWKPFASSLLSIPMAHHLFVSNVPSEPVARSFIATLPEFQSHRNGK